MRVFFPVSATLLLATACGIGHTYWPTQEELEAFEAAGPIVPELDQQRLLTSVPQPGDYRVVPGDLLEVRVKTDFLRRGVRSAGETDVFHARVSPTHTITLPLAGELPVEKKSPPEIETVLRSALHPRYLMQEPSVVVNVAKHRRLKVVILGAVESPGIYELRSDQMSLYGALTEAGGILKGTTTKTGARLIRIRRPGEDRSKDLILPVKGLNIPFSDVALAGGETIEVELWEPWLFTVVGLVAHPGAYEYPHGATYNLMQALAIAGGVDSITDPPYATVFRKDANDEIVAVTFRINGNHLVESSGVAIRAGDVIAVQHTAASWTRSLVSRVFGLQVGFRYNAGSSR